MADTNDNGNMGAKSAESIKTGQSSASSVKALLKKMSSLTPYLIGVFTLLCIIFIIIPNMGNDDTSKEKSSSSEEVSSAVQEAQRVKPEVAEAQWREKATDGSLPVGVWSETYEIQPGCTIHYNSGNGISYQVRYRFYDNNWIIHTGVGSGNASHVQFKIIKAGITEIPFRITCS